MDSNSNLDNEHVSIEVRALCNAFVEQTNSLLASYPRLHLDFTWPSIGVIDLLTFKFRYKYDLDENQQILRRGVASYLAIWIQRTWTSAGFSAEVKMDGVRGVCIVLDSEGKSYTAPIEEILIGMLQRLPNPMPVFKDFERPFTVTSNVMASICLGLLSGMMPGMDLPWKGAAGESEVLLKLEKQLAVQVAKWFQRVVPDSPLSHVPEQYLKGLILPPLLMSEEGIFVEASRELEAYWSSLGIPSHAKRDLILEYSHCADEQISSFAVSWAFSAPSLDHLDPRILGAALTHSDITPLMRSSLLEMRTRYYPNEGRLLGVSFIDSAEVFEIEKCIGTIPWLTLPFEYIQRAEKDQELADFLSMVLAFEYQAAIRQFDKVVEAKPADIQVRIQQVKLRMVAGDFEAAHELCKRLISEPEAETSPGFYSIWGSILLEIGEGEVAKRYLKTALSLSSITPELKADVLNNLAWCNIIAEKYKEAGLQLAEARTLSNCPLTIILNQAFVAAQGESNAEYQKYLAEAYAIAPFDRRVFANLIK